ncbi:MAG: rhomboid family intramembrane serine protease [Candidatus Eremiobacteraeota bacterium]|nr:rhomboid family intramembrane serine protease [Candidatus Eremiobacteraeota bacterium]
MLIPVDDDTASEGVPWVTYLLIALNVAIYFGGLWKGQSDPWILHYGHRAIQGISLTMLTSLFLHASVPHLLGNMWFLWITGDNVEGRLGSWRYLVFYLCAGFVSSLLSDHFLSGAAAKIPSVGASGAIAAVMGAYLYLFPESRIRIGCFIWLLPPIMLFSFKLPALVAIGFWFFEQSQSHLFQVVHGVTSPIGYAAHVAGFLFGALAMGLLHLAGWVRSDWAHQGAPVEEWRGPV